jgi:membrane dipeptidase
MSGGDSFSDADYARAIVIDGCSAFYDPYGPENETHFSARAVAEMRQSGETACTFTVNEVGNASGVWATTIKNIAVIDQMISDNLDILLKAATTVDIRRAKRENKIAAIYHLQDTSLIGADLDRLVLLKGLGVRVVQLTYNIRNLSGDGGLEPGNAGISKLGRATIARIEKEKLLLDLSHSGQRTVMEAIAAATRPMTISHTGCRALNDNPRNQWDAELRACAEKGGVVGIFWTPFLVPNGHATSAHLLQHMNHALDVCGEDHIAIGTDDFLFKMKIDDEARAAKKQRYEQRVAAGIAAPGEGPDVFNIVWDWDSHMRFRLLADGLAAEGWNPSKIEKVLGGNLMRLYAETWGDSHAL